ncbi:EAL domain-containing protein [Paraglaciecola aquimarina]|uniref:EAL domain-containing protein n=1 Tax=Paraglaciecola algarum TaxID=3050085 RepID=A0ABS9DBK7_9ALTE|nr:EAL domain-containing protein [Paraglaciecola sp. G1-23]MCF2950345.1 EAL domain-containing protein [Paraglaciecola sp. G1-23]
MTNKPSHSYINIIFVVILLLGVVISGFIYHTGNQIADNTKGLLTQKLPTYDLLREFNNNLTEQERFLYEFYATEDEDKFINGYLNTKQQAQKELVELLEVFGDVPPIVTTKNRYEEFNKLTDLFIQNIRSDNTDWNMAREHLSQLSEVRLAVIPQIQQLIELTKDNVKKSENYIVRDLGTVNFFVIFYALATLFIVYSVVKAWKAYLVSSAANERLSLFPKRNPNPVISLDAKNTVTFCNPASDRVLKQLGKPIGQAEFLLAPNIESYQQVILDDENIDSLLFEYAIDDFYFQCEIHWLADQLQWDVHLNDITARKKVEKELEYRASHDPDTGLKKRYELERTVKELSANQVRFSLGLIELRSYGQLVSSSGLTTASHVVKEVGISIQDIISKLGDGTCEAYRIGEKSFALISTYYLKKGQIDSLVAQIEQKISYQEFHHQYQVKLDFGFSCYPEHGQNYTQLHINSMAALDKSARSDDKSYAVFDLELGAKLAHEQKLVNDLKLALVSEEFELYFQPQLSLQSQKVIGAEVLIRWFRDGNWVSPAEFIPLAESAGLIVELGDWILRTACEKAQHLISHGFNDLVVAVNISPVQFARPDFLNNVTEVLEITGLPAQNLELEITEGVIIYNEVETLETLKALKDLGVKLAIDDFGTGYSSLSYLKKFNIDKLKIDQSFVGHIASDSADKSIVKAIIELGRNLQLTLIAEGVEELEQLTVLQDMGCDEIQGYYFSRPLAEQDFIQFMQNYHVKP